VTEPLQVALVQIDDYGPWTTTPTPRRETDLQSLQASLFADFATFVGEHDGYAFYGRFDNMFAVANRPDPTAFARFQRLVRNQYPVTVSVGVGRAVTPAAAMGVASDRLQAARSAQNGQRTEALAIGDDGGQVETGPVTIAHFDVVDVTGSLTDRENALDVTRRIRRASLELETLLGTRHDCLTHFVGGDNVIAVCPTVPADAFQKAIDHVGAETGLELQVGVGHDRTAHAAGEEAKHALETCRETGDRVRGTETLPADD
jgi:GTP cyclohydrolase IIa